MRAAKRTGPFGAILMRRLVPVHRGMRIVFAALLIVAVSVLGFGLYWQHRLSPVMKAQGVDLIPAPLELVAVESVRSVDLGFATFDLPAGFVGELVRHDDSLFVSVLSNPESRPGLTICPPLSNTDPEVNRFVQDYARFMEGSTPSLFEIRKRALYAQPFSIWSVPFRGLKRSQADTVLLALKLPETGGVTRLRVFESADIGIIISDRPEFSEVRLADKRSGVEQAFLLSAGAGNAVELASTLVRSYRFTTTERGEGDLLPLLAKTGIRQHLSIGGSGAPMDEASRLEAVAAQVRKRREKRADSKER
ncbi:hypothetical protein [Opitutus terrae]|uniref:Uncharacterized protein n=1 Tax=Opitutus terrae (strain DSM 11246 / JCM 15787 / PB90-1) TaxID=452637 RepID=B1ZNT9_OPITP|nr:hypothetical protein [Opitutus terrae]ACB75459.1 hypothetical protein Oter_2176 [Opitutus terrae PB90-1]